MKRASLTLRVGVVDHVGNHLSAKRGGFGAQRGTHSFRTLLRFRQLIVERIPKRVIEMSYLEPDPPIL